METILFFPAYAYGHINRCFKLARDLQEEYRVIFACPLKYKDYIIGNGFLFQPLSLQFSNVNNEEVNLTAFLKHYVRLLKKPEIKYQRKKQFQDEILFFESVIKDINPVVVFLDIFLSHYFPLLKYYQIKCICFQVYVSTHQTNNNFPLNTTRLPESNMFGRFCSWFLWKKYFLKVHLNAKIVRYLSGNTDNLSLFRKLWEEMNLIESELFDSKRAFFPGVKNVPELILSPLSFDFPGTKPRAFQVHMGMQMFERRKEDSLDRLFEKKYNTIKEKDIIFCSFGTLSFVHNKNLYKLVSLIAHLAEKVFTRYEFIFSVPLEMHFINSQLPNIHFFERVPQQQILKRCTLFITHGGINSIMEGIHFEVPMLVCPLNTKWDQPGNAARVENHQFGLKLIPEKEKERAVKDKLNLLLEKRDFFKENIRVYKENIIEDEVKFSKIMINRVLQG